MSVKERYRELCLSENSIPLFSRDWWLDTVCGEDNWDVLLQFSSKEVIAAMPIYTPKKDVISMPFYTQTMGPWIRELPHDLKPTSILSKKQEILSAFIPSLEKYSSVFQNFNYAITDWLPFYWSGYSQTTRYTYLLEQINDKRHLWEQMASNTKRNILKARDRYNITIKRGVSASELLRMQTLSFDRQNLKNKGTKILRRLIEQSKERRQGDVWGAYDSKGVLHAAIFVAWQPSSAYYIAGGSDPMLRSSGAHSLALWQAIEDVSEFTDTFDFEGSMLPGVERFFREFGAKQVPYFAIKRGKLSLYNRAYIKIQRILNGY